MRGRDAHAPGAGGCLHLCVFSPKSKVPEGETRQVTREVSVPLSPKGLNMVLQPPRLGDLPLEIAEAATITRGRPRFPILSE